MINKVSDFDRDLVSAAMMPCSKHALNMFLHGKSKITCVSITKRKEFTDVYIFSSNHSILHFVFTNKASFESLEKILTLEYSYLRIVYTKDTKSAFSSYINIDWLFASNDILRISSIIYQ